MSDGTRRWAAYAMLAGAACLWGSNHVVARGIHETVPLISLSFWRWAVALLLILPMAWGPLKKDWPVLKGHLSFIGWAAFVGIFIFTYAIYLAAYGTTAINVGLINATTPIWVLLIGVVWMSLRPRGMQWAGVALSMAGVVWIVIRGDMELLLALRFGLGDLWALAAAVIWAGYTLMLKRAPTGVNPFSVICVMIAMGAAMHVPVFAYDVLINGAAVFTIAEEPLADMIKIFYIGFGPAFLGYVFWNRGVEIVGAADAGVFLYLIPVAGAVLAMIFLGERMEMFHIVGIVGIAVGIYLTTRSPSKSG